MLILILEKNIKLYLFEFIQLKLLIYLEFI